MNNKSIRKEVIQLQKALARNDLKYFSGAFFPHYRKLPFAPFLLEIIKNLQEITLNRDRRISIVAPRAYAKSTTVTLIFVLWCICYKREDVILIVSHNHKLATKLLKHIKDEINSNALLAEFFPEVCNPPLLKCSVDEIIICNGISIMASSIREGLRGLRHKQFRPSLIILDDAEDDKWVRTQDMRDNTENTFNGVICGLGSEGTNIVVLGTILHNSSLLAKLSSDNDYPEWTKLKFKAIIYDADRQDLWDRCISIYRNTDTYNGLKGLAGAKKFYEDHKQLMLQGAEVLWPERESYFDLRILRERLGDFSFSKERQNEPQDPRAYTAILSDDVWIPRELSSPDALRRSIGSNCLVIGSLDPSSGKNNQCDNSAISTTIIDLNGPSPIIYVVGDDAGIWDLDLMVQKICLHHQIWNYNIFFYEDNGLQTWVGNMVNKGEGFVPLKPITTKERKEFRILRLIQLINSKRVKLSRNLGELIRELRDYPQRGKHVDSIDALATIVAELPNIVQVSTAKQQEIMGKFMNSSTAKNSKQVIGYNGKSLDDIFGKLFSA